MQKREKEERQEEGEEVEEVRVITQWRNIYVAQSPGLPMNNSRKEWHPFW